MLMFEWILVLLLAAVILTNLAERLAVPYPSLLAIAGVGLAFLAAARVINLAKHQPPSDLALIATKASLVVRNDLHPAIQYLLLNAATEIHSGQKLFHRANQFPAPEAVDTP